MSVLVKGMRMPSKCKDCPMYWYDRSISDEQERHICSLKPWKRFWGSLEVRQAWCPLVEVKTPHGRLIDADDYKRLLADDSKLWVLEHTPTIIEAED